MISREFESNEVNGMTTIQEAAKRLDVTPRRVLQFITQGRLRATKVNPRLYILRETDVEKFAKQPRAPGRKKKA